jgi:hypothetical protein
MNKLDPNNLCSHGGDSLAYLYDEMAVVEREKFEVHLADCTTCIDDFAELSQSRYPVFEWKHMEFDPLPTPRVVIPSEAASVSWFDKLRASFALRPAFAFGSLAAIAVVASLAALVLIGGSTGIMEVAGVVPTPAPVMPSPENTVQPSDRAMQPVPVVNEQAPGIRRDGGTKVVKASTSASKPPAHSARPKATQQAKRNEPLPALNSTDENEDDSLRLADIFEEIGTSES